jgi:2',3'-cyclic-nucleotide 2'-phosphodiesterase (5'-nucleotidase family)
VDNGGFFPEAADSLYRDKAWFLMDGMVLLGTDAVGMSEKELKYGRSWLLSQLKRSKLPMTNANVWDKGTKKTLLPQYLIVKKGAVNVGVFALTSDKVDLGPSRDSLTLEEPAKAATRVVAEMRKKGATVVVLLSQLGKVESEDLVTAVEGVDAVIVGRNAPMLQKGRLIKTTVACYGGEQGQYLGRTIMTLGPDRKATGGDNEVFMLGPEVGEKAEVAQIVKAFEDGFNEKLRKAEREKQTEAAARDMERNPDKYLGSEVCIRCHAEQAEQWKNTPHAKAWQTLVDNHKDAATECQECHVLGYKKPGGFQTGTQTPAMVNVQCESCHGMGTRHGMTDTVGPEVCQTCHTQQQSPNFQYDEMVQKIVHWE